jgi:hypothetical protein
LRPGLDIINYWIGGSIPNWRWNVCDVDCGYAWCVAYRNAAQKNSGFMPRVLTVAQQSEVWGAVKQVGFCWGKARTLVGKGDRFFDLDLR